MQLLHFIVSGAVSLAVVAEAASNCTPGNNCQRALFRTILPSRNPLVDCNSFLRVTVTPATS